MNIPPDNPTSPASGPNQRVIQEDEPSKSSEVVPAPGTRMSPDPSESTSDERVKQRTVSPETKTPEVNEHARIASLKSQFTTQWNSVQATRAEQHLLNHLDVIMHSLHAYDSASDDVPFIIIHIDETGFMNTLVPPDSRAETLSQISQSRESLSKSLQSIQTYFDEPKKRELRQSLLEAEKALDATKVKLEQAGIVIPDSSMTLAPVSINDFLQSRVPVAQSGLQHSRTGDQVYFGHPSVTPDQSTRRSDNEHSPSFVGPPSPPAHPTSEAASHSEQTSPKRLLNSMEYEESLASQPDSAQSVDIAAKASSALAYRQAVSDDEPDIAHTSRKAILFRLLVNLLKSANEYNAELQSFDDAMISLVQLGILSTEVSEQDVLNARTGKEAIQQCEDFLKNGERIHPERAQQVAGIVTGTAHPDSLIAKVMRDVIRLEDMRSVQQFDINSLECFNGAWVPDLQKKSLKLFCEQWRALLAKEEGLALNVELFNQADGYLSPFPDTLTPRVPALQRTHFDEAETAYKSHIQLISGDQELRYLRLLNG